SVRRRINLPTQLGPTSSGSDRLSKHSISAANDRRASSELERGDAKHPFEGERTDRSRVHPRRPEHSPKLVLFPHPSRLGVDARHTEKDFARARGLDQGGEDGLGPSAAVGDERADFVAAPTLPDHAPSGKAAIAHQRATDMAGRADPRAQEIAARGWKD